jgi:alkylation response protein AidB-like acyl-CoA dehydrogenase
VKFDLDDEQRLLADSVQRLLARDYAFEERRRILASPEGWSRSVWSSFAELGLLGIGISPDHGGYGGGATTTQFVMEAIGEALVVEPYLSTIGIAARLIERGGSPARKAALLEGLAGGRTIVAIATTERHSGHDPRCVSTRAHAAGSTYRIDGDKRVVLHAPHADLLVVSARSAGDEADAHGVDLFLVPSSAKGVTLRPYRTLDDLPAADVMLDGVEVAAEDRLGPASDAAALLEEALDYATALTCAEAVGALRYANAATLDYLKERRQFGMPIGSFQALQHRMVDMTIAYEQARSMAALACAAVDGQRDARERQHVVSAAKICIADACRLVSQEAVQLHGGMGMTQELKISHTFRRLTMLAQRFGDADHHLARFAATAGTTGGHA